MWQREPCCFDVWRGVERSGVVWAGCASVSQLADLRIIRLAMCVRLSVLLLFYVVGGHCLKADYDGWDLIGILSLTTA